MKKETCLIQSYSGLALDILNPDPQKIIITDAAHSLSQLCRFTGHTRIFYSVASHSILCSKLAPKDHPELQLACLLHDMQEYVLQDLATPFKKLFPRYKKIENMWADAIFNKYNLSTDLLKEVKIYDRMCLTIEATALMGPLAPIWGSLEVTWPEDYDLDYSLCQIEYIPPEVVEKQFLDEFNKLWLGRF